MSRRMVKTGKWVIMNLATGEYYVKSETTAFGTAHGWSEITWHAEKFPSPQSAEMKARQLPDMGSNYGICELIDFGDEISTEKPKALV